MGVGPGGCPVCAVCGAAPWPGGRSGVRERAPRSMVGRRGVDGECCRFFFCGNRTRTQRRGGPVDRLHRCRRAGLGAARPGGSGGHRLSCIYRSTSWLPSLPVQEVGSHRVDGCCISVMRSITSLTESGGPPDPSILPAIDDLARAASGLQVHELEHLVRPVGEGRAIDVLLHAQPWGAAAHRDLKSGTFT